MCGISGWFDTRAARSPDKAIVRAMTNAVAHRGPDGDGFFFAPGIGLGHRRLAIIDLSPGGLQPKASRDGRLQITFNGEIYNFRELRQELEAKGRHFDTKSDTEVILQAFEEWGEDAVSRLSGQFAFALWDSAAQCLYLVRDRLGEKPLYYSVLDDGGLIFGSELKALLVHPQLRRDIDPRAVEDFFALGYVAEPRSIYAGVGKVPAGGFIAFRRGAAPRTVQYWSPTPKTSHGSVDALAEELIARLSRAVKAQMVSDVPIGAFLSGGVDSSATTVLMAKASDTPIRCFTIGFEEKAFDETAYARRVAQQYGALHRVQTVSINDLEAVRSLPAIFDEPFGDSSALPALQLARLARQEVTVALSGDAGDELFAGYRRYRFHAREEQLRRLLPGSLRGPLFGLLAGIYPQMDWAPRFLRARQTFHELSLDTAHGFFGNLSVANDAARSALFSPRLKRDLQGYSAADTIAHYFDEAPTDDVLARAQYVDLKTWLPGDILTKVDRTAMAASLESRVPMLDHDFADWALGLPAEMKLRGGEGKFLLKKALEPMVPHDILYRPKQGFSIPLSDWMAGQMGQEFEQDLGAPGGLADCGLFEMGTVKSLLSRHRSGLSDNSRILWQLWMFQHFLLGVHGATPDIAPALEPAQ